MSEKEKKFFKVFSALLSVYNTRYCDQPDKEAVLGDCHILDVSWIERRSAEAAN